jgi:hypothetical protein
LPISAGASVKVVRRLRGLKASVLRPPACETSPPVPLRAAGDTSDFGPVHGRLADAPTGSA